MIEAFKLQVKKKEKNQNRIINTIHNNIGIIIIPGKVHKCLKLNSSILKPSHTTTETAKNFAQREV